jgi:hypothetical protein
MRLIGRPLLWERPSGREFAPRCGLFTSVNLVRGLSSLPRPSWPCLPLQAACPHAAQSLATVAALVERGPFILPPIHPPPPSCSRTLYGCVRNPMGANPLTSGEEFVKRISLGGKTLSTGLVFQ